MTLIIHQQWHDPGNELGKNWRLQVSSAPWALCKGVLNGLSLTCHELGAEEALTADIDDDDVRMHGGDSALFGTAETKCKWPNFQFLDTCFDQLQETGIRPVVGTTTRAWLTRGRGGVLALIHAVALVAGQPLAELGITLALPPSPRCEQTRWWWIGGRENDIVVAWRDLGAPAYLSLAQIPQLRAGNELAAAPAGELACGAGWMCINLAVPEPALLETPLKGTP